MVEQTKAHRGFQKTDIGEIPEDWITSSFLDMIDVMIDYRGRTPKKLGMDWGHGNILALSANNVEMGRINLEKEAYFASESLYKRWMQNGDCEKGDVLITMEAPLGNIAQIPDCKKYILSQRVLLIRPKINFNKDFIAEYLRAFYFQNQLLVNSSGSTAKGIQRQKIEKIEIYYPPTKEEQTAIATALINTDQLINSLEKLITKKQLIKQGAMQELLRPKEDWFSYEIYQLGNPYGGLSGKSKKDFFAGNSFYIPFLNIMHNPIIDQKYFDKVNVSFDENQNKAQKGDIFFNGSSETPEELGMCSVLLEDIPNLYLNSFCFGFRLNEELETNGLFLAYFFRSNYGRNIMRILAQGATRHNLSKNNFLNTNIRIPKPQEQTRIATILSDMDAEIKVLEKKLAKYKLIKQGMMQNLLTGKIRLL